MAARTRRGTKAAGWDKSVRERIKTSMLMNRLTDHVLGKCELSQTQVRATEILLRKVLPDLAAIEHTGDVQTNYVVQMPAPVADLVEWQKQYATDNTVDNVQQSADKPLTTH